MSGKSLLKKGMKFKRIKENICISKCGIWIDPKSRHVTQAGPIRFFL